MGCVALPCSHDQEIHRSELMSPNCRAGPISEMQRLRPVYAQALNMHAQAGNRPASSVAPAAPKPPTPEQQQANSRCERARYPEQGDAQRNQEAVRTDF